MSSSAQSNRMHGFDVGLDNEPNKLLIHCISMFEDAARGMPKSF